MTRSGATGAPVLHWDGSQLALPSAWPRTQSSARALWGEAANKVWFIASDPVRWDGQAFNIERQMTPVPGLQLWGSGPGDLWALGNAEIRRGDGWRWGANVGPLLDRGTSERLFTIHGLSGNDVWASSYRPHHWDGSQWTTHGEGGTLPLLTDGWAADQNNAWAVGSKKNQAGQNVGTILRRSNGRWQEIFIAPESLSGIWGSTNTDIWACGDSGGIYHWDGTQWTKTNGGIFGPLRKIRGTDKSYVVAVGDGGTIIKWNGTNWSPETSGVSDNLFGVFAPGNNSFFAVGDNGVILIKNGPTWLRQQSNTNRSLYDVWGTAPNAVWAVGDNGTILFYDGSRWQSVTSGTTSTLSVVHGLSASEVFIGGTKNAFRWNGQNIESVPMRYFPMDVMTGMFSSGQTMWSINVRGFIMKKN